MKKWCRIVFLTVMMMSLVLTAGASRISDLQRELDRTEKEITNINSRIQEVQTERSSVQKEIDQLDKVILELTSEEIKLQMEIAAIEDNIEAIEQDIQEIQNEIQVTNELLEQRLRAMYKNGAVGYLEVLFNASDLSDFLTRMDMIQRIVRNDVNILEELEQQYISLDIAQLSLQNERHHLELAMNDVKLKRTDIEVASRAKEGYMRSLQGNIDELKAQEQKLLEASDEIEKKIQLAQLEMKYAGGEMAWPSPGYYRITSPYGMRPHPLYGHWSMHTGVDVGVPMKQRIVAANTGVVTYAGWFGAYGIIVLIDHGGGISTLYAHNNSVVVSEGQSVTKGQLIAYSGTTGMSTGPHLHFEVRTNGTHTDPMEYLQ